MKVIKLTPRGYCKGVVRAIELVKEASKSYQGKIYVLGMIVHNKFVSDALQLQGIVSLDTSVKTKEEWIQSLDEGLLVFTAHGISPQTKQLAIDRGLDVLDATCFDVTKTQTLIASYRKNNYDVIYIGKKGHPESQAMQANDPHIHLIQTKEDLDQLTISNPNILVTNQTTMSILDIQALMDDVRRRYPSAVVCEEVCAATRVRQEAVLALKEATILVIVGDPKSNNSTRLVTINKDIQRSHMVESVQDIDPSWFQEGDVVAVSSGASTPTYITNQVITFLENFELDDTTTHSFPAIEMTKIL